MNILEDSEGCGWGHNDDGGGRFSKLDRRNVDEI